MIEFLIYFLTGLYVFGKVFNYRRTKYPKSYDGEFEWGMPAAAAAIFWPLFLPCWLAVRLTRSRNAA